MDRRKFLIASGGVLGLSVLGGVAVWQSQLLDLSTSTGEELYSAFGKWEPIKIDQVAAPIKSHLVFFSLAKFQPRIFDVPFRVHTGIQDPRHRQNLVLVGKWGREICVFNRQSGDIRSLQTTTGSRRFFGHGVWDEASGGIWLTENDDQTGQGYLVLRDRQLKVIREIPSHGMYPHELQMADQGVLLVANTGNLKDQAGRLNWIHAKSGELVKSIEFTKAMGHAGPSHFVKSKVSGDFYIGSITSKANGPSYVWRVGSDMKPTRVEVISEQRRLFRGEVVSIVETKKNPQILWTQADTRAVFAVTPTVDARANVVMKLNPHGMIADGGGVVVTKRVGIVKWSDGDVDETYRGPKLENERWGSHVMRAEA